MLVVAKVLRQRQLAVCVVWETLQDGCKLFASFGLLAKRIQRHPQFDQAIGGKPFGMA